MQNYYCSFDDYMVSFYGETYTFDISCKGKVYAKNIEIYDDGKKCEYAHVLHTIDNEFNILHLNGFCSGTVLEIQLCVYNDGVKIITNTPVTLKGTVELSGRCFAMSTEEHGFIRCAYGNGCTPLDNMIFDAENDCGLVLDGVDTKRFAFDYNTNEYKICTPISETAFMYIKENVYANKYKINYAPINKNVTFKKPPVGWMTWYSVMFDASEKTVLDNTKWMSENLKKYGAETIWVDWEWYHKDLTGIRDDGCNCFSPDKVKYPNGLKYVSDEIRKCGLVPSLWIGFTNEPAETEFIKEHPEAVLLHEPTWCGQYYYDLSHPAYLNEFLPKALAKVDEWGYEAVKYDTLPISMRMHELHHDKMYNPNLTTKEAFRNMYKKTREILGKDRYLLSCAGVHDPSVLYGCDIFDAARVGGDVFTWHEFIETCVKKVARYYPLHNVVFYNDPDNVVIREKYNNLEQAKSRTAFVGMLGLPVTFGDNLPELPEERVELLRRCIPVLDIHPMDVTRIGVGDTLITDLVIENECLDYNVLGILNCKDESVTQEISLKELGVDYKNPIAFEYFSSSVAEVKDGVIKAELKPYETKVFAIHENRNIPQIISTSRHITQGVIELENVQWNDMVLGFAAKLVEGDNYVVTLNVPCGYKVSDTCGMKVAEETGNILKLSYVADEDCTKTFEIKFEKGEI